MSREISEQEKRIKATNMVKRLLPKPQVNHKGMVKKEMSEWRAKNLEVYGGKSKKAIEKVRKIGNGWLKGVCQGRYTYPDLFVFKKEGKEEKFNVIEVLSYNDDIVKKLDSYLMSLAEQILLVLPPLSNPDKLVIKMGYHYYKANSLNKIKNKLYPFNFNIKKGIDDK